MTSLVLVVLGPTASGKTRMAVHLAKGFNGEVVSADSRQFYREMTIGTAKPGIEEMQSVPHHFVGALSMHDVYNAGTYERDALAVIDQLQRQGKVPVVAGGSGLYIKALLEGFDDLPSDIDLRNQLNHHYKEQGLHALQEKLKALDPNYFMQVDRNNPVRLIRAIELVTITGKRMKDLQTGRTGERQFTAVKIGLELPRAELYARINSRVDRMMEAGLVEESHILHPHKHLQALQTVGYSELFDHFDGRISLEEAVELIKRNSRRYAKRQLTWLRRDADIRWFHATDEEGVIAFVESCLQRER